MAPIMGFNSAQDQVPAQAPKGKPPTKGMKQILMDNDATVKFYRNMAMGSMAIYGAVMVLFYKEDLQYSIIALNILVLIIYIMCYQTLVFMSRPKYTENMALIDPGLDLNMEGGVGEHIKDIIILLSVTLQLALISNYFWLVLLLIPIRAMWLVWVNILGPWFFQPAPQDTEQDDKKKKKMERRMKRQQ